MSDGCKPKASVAFHPYVTRDNGMAGDGYIPFKVCIVADVGMGLDIAVLADIGHTHAGRAVNGHELPYCCPVTDVYPPRFIRPFIHPAPVLGMGADNAVGADVDVIAQRYVEADDGRWVDVVHRCWTDAQR